MKATTVRVALAAAVAASTMVGTAPSHAGVGDGWVIIDTGQVSGTADVTGLVDAVLGLVANVGGGHGKPCTPKYSSIQPGGLGWTVYQNRYTLELALEWNGPGFASVSEECAQGLALSVQVNDYAPKGNPPVAQGDPGSANDGTPSGGEFDAYAESKDWVTYYNPPSLYTRGNSVVELKVSAQWLDPKHNVWVPLGCKVTQTSVTVWPDGRVDATPSPTEDCAA